jgi:UDP-glucose 4-epimerase
MKTALVTGVAGFLGSHVADLLLGKGYYVVGVDNLSHGYLRNLQMASRNPNFEFSQLDVCNFSSLRDAVRSVDLILHLAALKIPRYGKTTDTLITNSEGTINVLRLAHERSAKVILTSTSDVYGKNPVLPFSEDDDSVLGPPTVARWAYAVSKLFDEHLVLAKAEELALPATIVRIFGSYGPRQNLSWWGGPQSVFIDAILRGQSVPIHGDGMQTRSFTYVSDTASGIVAAAESEVADREIINIGSNYEISILQLAERIHRLCGVPEPLRFQMTPYDQINMRKYEDVRRRIPDIVKAKKLLGFEAKVSLDDGLTKTIAWQRGMMESLSNIAKSA